MAKFHDTTYRKQPSPAHFHNTVVCLNRLFEIGGPNVNNSSPSMNGNEFSASRPRSKGKFYPANVQMVGCYRQILSYFRSGHSSVFAETENETG